MVKFITPPTSQAILSDLGHGAKLIKIFIFLRFSSRFWNITDRGNSVSLFFKKINSDRLSFKNFHFKWGKFRNWISENEFWCIFSQETNFSDTVASKTLRKQFLKHRRNVRWASWMKKTILEIVTKTSFVLTLRCLKHNYFRISKSLVFGNCFEKEFVFLYESLTLPFKTVMFCSQKMFRFVVSDPSGVSTMPGVKADYSINAKSQRKIFLVHRVILLVHLLDFFSYC